MTADNLTALPVPAAYIEAEPGTREEELRGNPEWPLTFYRSTMVHVGRKPTKRQETNELFALYTEQQVRALLAARDAERGFGAALAELVFDGCAVLAAANERDRKYISVESLGAVLDSLVRAARHAALQADTARAEGGK